MPSILDTRIVNRHRVQPNHANNYGTAHGGNVMKWMDEVAAMSAMRFAGETCVTARMDGLDFANPIPTGDIAVVDTYAYDAGRTSVKVHGCVDREDPRSGERERATEATFVFVAVQDGDPVPVPDLTVEGGEEERLLEAARGEVRVDA